MKKVMAQGTFDIIHPGHIHYFKQSEKLGDELVVVISRDSRVKDRKSQLCFSEEERRKIVETLEPVDKAILGSEEDIYETVKQVDPDVITLGYDQEHEEKKVKKMAEEATGHEVEIARISGKEDYSSSDYKT
jgi:FAD synthetase